MAAFELEIEVSVPKHTVVLAFTKGKILQTATEEVEAVIGSLMV